MSAPIHFDGLCLTHVNACCMRQYVVPSYAIGLAPYIVQLALGLRSDDSRGSHVGRTLTARAVCNDFGDLVIVGAWL